MTTDRKKYIKKKSLTRLFELSFGFEEVNHPDFIPHQSQSLVEIDDEPDQLICSGCECIHDFADFSKCDCCLQKFCKDCLKEESFLTFLCEKCVQAQIDDLDDRRQTSAWLERSR